MQFRFLDLLTIPALMLLMTDGHAARCGTAQWMERLSQRPLAKGFALQSYGKEAGRSLVTEHFVLHYSLFGVNRPKVLPADEELYRLRDSVSASLPAGLQALVHDSRVYSAMDSLGAPHPVFVVEAARLLEAAWRSYVLDLGMRKPTVKASGYFHVLRDFPGKFPVELADLITATGDWRNADTYGLTYPPTVARMLVENDFLFEASLLPDGSVHGIPIRSKVNGTVYTDYSVDWEKGLKVTVFHEFYHAMQFAYTPNPKTYHAWYEIGATSMEERYASEVDDYFQYMHHLHDTHDRLGILQAVAPVNRELANYANGIFHLFLTHALGEDFDVQIWQRLAVNSNDVADALSFMLENERAALDTLFASYSAQLLFSGSHLDHPFRPVISSDMPRWPEFPVRAFTLEDTAQNRIHIPPLAQVFFELKSRDSSRAHRVILSEDAVSGVLIRISGSRVSHQVYRNEEFLLFPSGPGERQYLVLANAFLTQAAAIVSVSEPRTQTPELWAYPNPLSLEKHGALQLRRTLPVDSAQGVAFYDEFGHPVQTVAFFGDEPVASWSLASRRGSAIPPGVYYFRTFEGKLKPLVVTE